MNTLTFERLKSAIINFISKLQQPKSLAHVGENDENYF